jgi:hypothetical protein
MLVQRRAIDKDVNRVLGQFSVKDFGELDGGPGGGIDGCAGDYCKYVPIIHILRFPRERRQKGLGHFATIFFSCRMCSCVLVLNRGNKK